MDLLFHALDYHEEFFRLMFVNHSFEEDHHDRHVLHQQLSDPLDFLFHSIEEKGDELFQSYSNIDPT